MKNYYCAVLFFLMATSGIFAQINFEKGSFITENGQKTDCYIKNMDWENNPTKFEYRLTPEGDTKVLRLTNLKTLVIDNAFKFEKHTVQIDESDRSLKKLTYERSPKFTERTLLLNVLIEGKATLYAYIDSDKKTYFYKKDTENIQPLIYKIYTNENRDILYNKRYQQQLLSELPCASISEKKVTRVDYNRADLAAFFKDYNECTGEDFTEFDKPNNGIFHLKGFAGIYSGKSTTELGLITFYRTLESSSELSPTFGAELEYVFPFNKNKWAMFIAPHYSSYEGEGSYSEGAIQRTIYVEYKSIQLPLGFRHYFFLENSSKIFVSAAALIDFPLSKSAKGVSTISEDSFRTTSGAAFGVGYSFDKYSVEVRYIPPRELLERTLSTSIKLQQVSLTLGYTIF